MNCFQTTGVPCILAQSQRPDLFEIHLTIAPPTAAELVRFRALCAAQAWKAIVIAFDSAAPPQPMTCSRIAGSPDDARRHAAAAAALLEAAGFAPTRLKIEAAPWNSHVPADDEARASQHESAYFEHHAKLRLPRAGWQPALLPLCAAFDAHVSRNAFRQTADGWTERFATIRSPRDGLAAFERRTADFGRRLRDHGFALLASVTEYCVYDSNAALDDLWLSPSTPA
ncbi:MAG TPA: hypothetical protein VGE07_01185 [Herpetosiphonaceae bacterium]